MREPIQLVIAVSLCLCSPLAAFGQEKAEPKPTQFQETAQMILGGSAMQIHHCSFLPHYMSWRRFRFDDFNEMYARRFKEFPSELVKVISNRESKDYEAAVEFLTAYVGFARSQAGTTSDKELARVAWLALAPNTAKLQEGLFQGIQGKNSVLEITAAMGLLFLDEKHERANEVLKASSISKEPDVPSAACGYIGLGRLASPQAVEFVGKMLAHRDSDVRESAADAVIALGPAARELVPDLIAFLKTGKDAEGDYRPEFAMVLPHRCNLAIMALTRMKHDAKPAVPTILARFPDANEEDQIAMLSCLASAGSNDSATLALVRKSMEVEKLDLKLAAACTLLHLVPNDRETTDSILKALTSTATKKLAIETCEKIGPQSLEIVKCLISMLEDEKENVRIGAMLALAGIGPIAAEAAPGIEKLLAKLENGTTHTFRSNQAAAYALAQIGGKSAADAILRTFVDANLSGMPFAAVYLPTLGEDVPANSLEVLLGALKKGHHDAAFAICNLGERARPIRAELERFLDDEAVGWIIDTALRRMGEDGK